MHLGLDAPGLGRAAVPTMPAQVGMDRGIPLGMAGMVGALSGVFLVALLTRRVEREVELLEDDLTMDH